MFRRFRITAKRMAAFFVVASMTLLVGGLGVHSTTSLAESIEYLGKFRITDLQSLSSLNFEGMVIRSQTLEVLQSAGRDDRRQVLVAIQEQRASSWRNTDKAWEQLQVIPRNNERGRKLIAQLRERYSAWRDSHREMDKAIEALAAASETQNAAAYAAFREKVDRMTPLSDAYGQALEELIANNTTTTARIINENMTSARKLIHLNEMMMIAGLVLSLGLGGFASRAITRPIKDCVHYTGLLAQGDFSSEVPQAFQRRGDEIGELARAYQTMTVSIRAILHRTLDSVKHLSLSSADLATVSRQLTASAQEMTDKSDAVAAATEEMSVNFQSVSAAMEQSTGNVNMIASSTEQMNATVNEIAESAEKARTISENAVQQARQVSARMANLGTSANKIGRVTETINEISEQTNLLALNATIEAARAGEAGKGFAVVANEIKDLARQTATATVDIKHQIEEMQTTAGATMDDIRQISQVIVDISNVINGIATSVEEQSVATSEIAGNIANSSQGIAEVNEHVAQSTTVATDITRDVSGISAQAREVGQGSARVHASAQQLSGLATQLQGLVRQFQL